MENKLITLVPDWKNVPVGTKFKAIIKEVICEGRIQKEDGYIFLCQNEKDGADCKDKLEFKYSWSIRLGEREDLSDTDVQFISLELDSSFNAPPTVDLGDYTVVFKKGEIQVGCQVIKNEKVTEVVKNLIW